MLILDGMQKGLAEVLKGMTGPMKLQNIYLAFPDPWTNKHVHSVYLPLESMKTS